MIAGPSKLDDGSVDILALYFGDPAKETSVDVLSCSIHAEIYHIETRVQRGRIRL